VIVANGENFKNLDRIIEGDSFKGTVIMPYRIDASFYDRKYYTGDKAGYRFAQRSSLIGKLFIAVATYYRAAIIKFFESQELFE
jgi:hypothetical protein